MYWNETKLIGTILNIGLIVANTHEWEYQEYKALKINNSQLESEL